MNTIPHEQTIIVWPRDARRIANHFITRGWWFKANRVAAGFWHLTFSVTIEQKDLPQFTAVVAREKTP